MANAPSKRPEDALEANAPTSAAELVGSIVGQYQLLAELATGGMGTVYRAKHELIDRVAAVKLLRPEFSANPEIVERFFNEARAATAIRHPGIVEVLDFGFLGSGNAYLVMEFLEGQTLAARLHERTRLSEVEAAVICRGIASALGAAHAKGIIHRDLKPDNVFLVPDPDMPSGERPKVLDFGIAKLADDGAKVNQTRTGTLMGTPAYMAPEQARAAGEIDPRADLYALGCIMYEMLTGTTPFVAEGAGELIALQLFGQPERLRARVPSVSPEIDSLVMRLLEKEPAARPQSAAEVMELLTRAIPSLTGVVASVNAPATVQRTAVGAAHSIVIPRSKTPISLTELRDGPASQPKAKNRLGLVAGLATVTLVAGVAAFVVLRATGSTPTPKPTVGSGALVAPPAGSAAMAPTGSAAALGSAAEAGSATVGPPQDANVVVFFSLTPANATVAIDGITIVPEMTGTARVPRSSKPSQVSVSAPGFQTREGVVTFDRDQQFRIELDRNGKKPKSGGFIVTAAPTVGRPTPPPVELGSGSGPGPDGPSDDPGQANGSAEGPATAPETTPEKAAGSGDKPTGSGDKPAGSGIEVGGMQVNPTVD